MLQQRRCLVATGPAALRYPAEPPEASWKTSSETAPRAVIFTGATLNESFFPMEKFIRDTGIWRFISGHLFYPAGCQRCRIAGRTIPGGRGFQTDSKRQAFLHPVKITTLWFRGNVSRKSIALTFRSNLFQLGRLGCHGIGTFRTVESV